MFIVGKIKSAKGHTMTYIKLLTVLAGLALLTACGGGGGTAETKTDDTGEPAVSCDTNPYGADCGTEFETQRLNIVSECTDDDTGDLCDDATTFACTDDFFHTLCNDIKEYEDKRTNFNNVCTNTKSKEVCDAEALVRNCAANPFMNTCLMDTGAIALRESRCLANIQIDDSCRGTTGIATLFCEANPFDPSNACMHGDYADDRQTACLANIQIDGSCRGTTGIATLFCEADPFNTATACMADAYNDERLTACTGDITTPRCMQIVTPVCEANNGFNNPVCRGIEKYDELLRCSVGEVCVVNTADWVAGFTPAPVTTGDYTREVYYEFVQGTEDGVDFGTIRNGGVGSLPALNTLDFKSLAGEAKNGVAWFEAHSGVNGLDLPRRNYSGIFSGTSLGAPLTSADASVTVPWAGKFGWIYTSADGLSSHGSGAKGKDFDLTVDFANSEIRAFVNRTGADHFLLKATFDNSGRFDGTINHGTFAGSVDTATPTNVITGVLTGLIGELGAVGAFYGGADDTDDSQGDFAGGFVAISPKEAARIERERLAEVERLRLERERIARELLISQVTFTDWIGGFDTEPPATPTTTTANQFLAGTTTLDPLSQITPTLLTSTIGGVGFFTENSQYYAGLLSNTNVGLPVAITPQADGADVTATWTGMIRGTGIFDGSGGGTDKTQAVPITALTVNFTARTLKTGRIAEPGNGPSASIEIDGKFLATDDGVITGRVIQRHGNVEHLGDLTGVIGQNGAVGAFYSQSTVPANNRYVGGFYAAPSNN